MKKLAGFTLIEVMIVVAIVGILVAIALPSYQQHVIKTRRHDAMGNIMTAATALERFKTRNGFSYTGAVFSSTLVDPNVVYTDKSPVDGNDVFYELSLDASTTAYTITATPKNVQAKDGLLTITNTGFKTWPDNPDGSGQWDDK